MKYSIVLSTQPAQFQAATFKGDLEANLRRIASLGYDGVELAIRDPKLVDYPGAVSYLRWFEFPLPFADNSFDLVSCLEALEVMPDVEAPLAELNRILRPGGVALVTVPAVSRLAHTYHTGADYWRFTPASCARLFGETFGAEHVTVSAYGNVLTAMAFLTGLAEQELSPRELDTHDPSYPVVVAVRAVKQPKEV